MVEIYINFKGATFQNNYSAIPPLESLASFPRYSLHDRHMISTWKWLLIAMQQVHGLGTLPWLGGRQQLLVACHLAASDCLDGKTNFIVETFTWRICRVCVISIKSFGSTLFMDACHSHTLQPLSCHLQACHKIHIQSMPLEIVRLSLLRPNDYVLVVWAR